jgi:hypothetical protein
MKKLKMNLKKNIMLIESRIEKYKRNSNLEDGFKDNKPFVYSVNGDIFIDEEKDLIKITEDGSKLILGRVNEKF